jgi:predicted transcriptional regulator
MARRTNSRRLCSQVTSAPKPAAAIVQLAGNIVEVERFIQQNATENVELQMQVNRLGKRINDNVEEGRNLHRTLATLHRDMDKHTATSR